MSTPIGTVTYEKNPIQRRFNRHRWIAQIKVTPYTWIGAYARTATGARKALRKKLRGGKWEAYVL